MSILVSSPIRALSGDRVVVPVEITGVPTPRFTWTTPTSVQPKQVHTRYLANTSQSSNTTGYLANTSLQHHTLPRKHPTKLQHHTLPRKHLAPTPHVTSQTPHKAPTPHVTSQTPRSNTTRYLANTSQSSNTTRYLVNNLFANSSFNLKYTLCTLLLNSIILRSRFMLMVLW